MKNFYLPAALLALGVGTSAQGASEWPLNNGGDILYYYSSPSIGAAPLDALPDLNGDLYWRSHAGGNSMDDVDALLSSSIEIVGYHEWIYDTDWSTTPAFYTRAHGPALANAAGAGSLAPAFLQLGATSEVFVSIGPSGLGNPCTVAPTLCSGGACPPPGLVVGYNVELAFGSTPGAGVVLPADGSGGADPAVTWFLPGGMTQVGGACGAGDYTLQDLHSNDETQADSTGNAINPWGGLQLGGSPAAAEPLTDMAVSHVRLSGNSINVMADSGTGLGVETSFCGGGGTNGRALRVGAGGATLGVELRDDEASPGDLGFVGASLTPIPNPGVSVLGASLLVQPDALFLATVGQWQGPMVPSAAMGNGGLVMVGAQLPVPPTAGGVTLHLQGVVLAAGTLTADSTNRAAVVLVP